MDHAPARATVPPATDAHVGPPWDVSLLVPDSPIGTTPPEGDADRRAWASEYEEIE